MNCYIIAEALKETTLDELSAKRDRQYVAVLTSAEWAGTRESFNMGIDIEPDLAGSHTTKAEVNYDSLTGSFCIPDRNDLSDRDGQKMFCFALDEKGIVFIDDTGEAQRIIDRIRKSKKWALPCLERFIYDFLEQIVSRDRVLLEKYEDELDEIESSISSEKNEEGSDRANGIRGEIRDLRVHYEQLLDFAQELEENENEFFKEENLRYFRLFLNRVERLRASAIALGDHAHQINEIYRAELDVRQNRIMTVLTIITSIFMPLTLIAGWYGMNFKYMPELGSKLGYPIVIAVSVLIVIVSLLFFKRKKWL